MADAAALNMLRVAYVVSRYPLISHAFIVREVRALRGAGARVDTFTVRRPARTELLSQEDHDEDAATYSLVPPRLTALLGSHVEALVRAPGRYLRALRAAFAERPPGARSLLWHLFYFGEAPLLWRECRRRGIRHIHAHHANVASDIALLACVLGGPGWSWTFTMHGPTEFFDARAHRLSYKTRHADAVACISDYTRSQLIGLVTPSEWTKLRVIHCSVDTSRFDGRHRPRTQPSEVVTVGRLVPAKAQALLIEALAALRGDGVDARLTIVGDGPLRPHLEELAERTGVAGEVEFAGSVGQDDIPGFYERADLFALSSVAEGLPVVLMEAMATGLPVVAPGIAGIPELIEDGVSGIVVTPGRPDELAAAIASLFAEPAERRAAIGSAGRAKVISQFNPDRSARQLLEMFAAAKGGDRTDRGRLHRQANV